jgi:hypothetical protein
LDTQDPSPPILEAKSATQETAPTPASILDKKSMGRKLDGCIPELYATLVEMDHDIAHHTHNVADIVNSTVPIHSDDGLHREEQ